MKKLPLLSIICLLFGSAAIAQKVDMDFTDFKIVDQNEVKLDTVYIGQTYAITGKVTNLGPDAANGDMDVYYKASKNVDWKPGKMVGTLLSSSIPFSDFEYLDTKNLKLFISVDNKFQKDTYNIVITWPTGSVMNHELDSNNDYDAFKIWVKADPNEIISGIAKQKTPLFSVYPNPSSGSFNIILTGKDKASISVSDITGKLIYRRESEGSRMVYNAENLSNGVYLVSVNYGDHKEIQKLIINR